MDNEFQSPNDVGAQRSFNSVIGKKKEGLRVENLRKFQR